MTLRDEEDLLRESYERVPYASGSYHHTHPDHLATLALLHGLETAPPARCRVLELGCADGGNLVPMALELPESRFTGIDLSPRQIETGLANVRELGLTNVDLRVMSILDVVLDRDASLGTFDYVLCHGVYSWVDADVREKILALCRATLAANGIAYVSYNALPGWHVRRFVRDLLQHATRGAEDPAARSFELIRFLSDATARDQDAWAQILRGAREQFEAWAEHPEYILHDYLERTNAPLYFHEFVAHASRHGLRYAGDAEPPMNESDNLGPEVSQRLRALSSDPLEQEQYFDFVVNRSFRRTLLVHEGASLDRTMQPERMRRLHAASSARPVSDQPDLRAGIPEAFRNERGKPFTSTHPAAKGLLVALAEAWPRSLSFDQLLMRVVDADEALLADLLWSLYWSGVAELHVEPPQCANEVSELPRVSELARRQAARGAMVTNLRRRVLKIDDPVAMLLITHLDGTRDRAALLRLLDREASAGRLDITAGEQRVDPARIPMVLQAVLDHHLTRLVRLALLE
ncbi:MAG TPA: class I SAM-dependent methyltransferase [Thermoanaerobaculia bacterium]|jgi:methyltransferase-like protein|nr:class I SAM-dependent methyltransferase [Thermoanaerobaculia bacterium]